MYRAISLSKKAYLPSVSSTSSLMLRLDASKLALADFAACAICSTRLKALWYIRVDSEDRSLRALILPSNMVALLSRFRLSEKYLVKSDIPDLDTSAFRLLFFGSDLAASCISCSVAFTKLPLSLAIVSVIVANSVPTVSSVTYASIPASPILYISNTSSRNPSLLVGICRLTAARDLAISTWLRAARSSSL